MKMPRAFQILFGATVVLIGAASMASTCLAQDAKAAEARSFPEAKVVLGLEGFKHNATGTLAAENGSLVFTKGKKKVVVPAAKITEVLTGKDTERALGGTVGTMTMFAPYGGGRFLSLFRNKIDTLSIEYVDSTGGIHGAIFTLGQGTAWSAKGALLSQGAKTSMPLEAEIQEQTKKKEKKQ